MTTMYTDGKFWVIDAVTGQPIDGFPPYATFAEAREVIGDRWCEPDALFPDLDL